MARSSRRSSSRLSRARGLVSSAGSFLWKHKGAVAGALGAAEAYKHRGAILKWILIGVGLLVVIAVSLMMLKSSLKGGATLNRSDFTVLAALAVGYLVFTEPSTNQAQHAITGGADCSSVQCQKCKHLPLFLALQCLDDCGCVTKLNGNVSVHG